MKHIIIVSLLILLSLGSACAQDSVRIYGRVTDFNNNPVDSVSVRLKENNFKNLYEVFTDRDGYFSFKALKRNYYCLYAIRLRDYSKTKLEYWAWNIPAIRDLEINPRYERMEIYGVNAFEPQAGPFDTYMIYFRPMSLTKALELEKQKAQGQNIKEFEKKSQARHDTLDIAPSNITKEELQVSVNHLPAEILCITKVPEYGRGGWMYGYLIQVKKPKENSVIDFPYDQITIVLHSNETGDMGMGECFVKRVDRKAP
ncbi:MAG TPA: carboxypeptidase-like regulatory domain-containing protein [Bacteroidales bacterium]|nr:carboxypeptidase-like regulatory domain-containing protein [Bacteroidales bacterium]HPT10768.1 carboxypeptidase-like regulatory domain-containing protein [Bacteroidales bacterium]